MNTKTRMSPAKAITLIGVSVLTAIVVLVIAFNGWTIVGVGKEKVGSTFGKVHESALTSGFHFVNPLADFERYDLQEMTYTWEDFNGCCYHRSLYEWYDCNSAREYWQ